MIKKIFCYLFIILNIKSIQEDFEFDDQIDFETSIYNNLSDEELNFDYNNESNIENYNEDDLFNDQYRKNFSENFDQYDEKISEYSDFVCNFLKDKLLIWETFIINEEISKEEINNSKKKETNYFNKTKKNKKNNCKCLKN